MNVEISPFGHDWPFSKAKTSLLRAAALVMREEGPRSATLKNIAARAGVTEPAIFRHFAGVDGLFEALFTVVEFFFRRLEVRFLDCDTPGLERLHAAYEDLVDVLQDSVEFGYLVIHADPIFRQYAALRQRLEDIRAASRERVIDCLREAQDIGQIPADMDVDTLAVSLIGAVALLLTEWSRGNDMIDPSASMRRVWEGVRSIFSVAEPAGAPSANGGTAYERARERVT
ncbi:MAG: TetR/AcrR family transcriptional regulator [Spirochaetales bacterium]|nr:TetR/AcrR family transcriptional regulator [Spirochaetales bacterium]MBP7263347.1 TetR/AcrR family transcriptional regulator [Spirochaetia bacterium]